MSIYDFSLASWYEPSGVDAAMCYRASLFQKLGYDVKMIFPTPPYRRDFLLYTGMGLQYDQMLGVHSSFTDLKSFEPTIPVEQKVSELQELLGCTRIIHLDDRIQLIRDNVVLATLLLTEDKKFFYCVEFFTDGLLIRRDYYADTLYASWFYVTVTDETHSYAKLQHRFFYNSDGSLAFMHTVEDETECNMYADGATYNREEFFALFVQNLHLTKEDLVIIDRSSLLFTMKPLLAMHDQTNIITIIHSEHYFEKGRSVEGYYLNREYWYWFKYSKYIHGMIVSTEGQKKSLEDTLNQYGLAVPQLDVIPALSLDQLHYPEKARRRKSVVCISRLNQRKKIEWTIFAIIKAHAIDPEITLDIYGKGEMAYVDYLKDLIRKNDASDYITIVGYMNVTEIYKEYEVFLTTSLWETFGITLLEATGSGLAMVGFDVEYGNRLFIEEGRNGYLVPYDTSHFMEDCPSETDLLAEKVVQIFADEQRLAAFSEYSYTIASRYLSEQINNRWEKLLAQYPLLT